MIETSVKRSEDGVRVTDKVVASVEEVAVKSTQLEQQLAEIVAKAQKVDEQVAQIASASQEQKSGHQRSESSRKSDGQGNAKHGGECGGSAAAAEKNSTPRLACSGCRPGNCRRSLAVTVRLRWRNPPKWNKTFRETTHKPAGVVKWEKRRFARRVESAGVPQAEARAGCGGFRIFTGRTRKFHPR